jgi:hypothetical protein
MVSSVVFHSRMDGWCCSLWKHTTSVLSFFFLVCIYLLISDSMMYYVRTRVADQLCSGVVCTHGSALREQYLTHLGIACQIFCQEQSAVNQLCNQSEQRITSSYHDWRLGNVLHHQPPSVKLESVSPCPDVVEGSVRKPEPTRTSGNAHPLESAGYSSEWTQLFYDQGCKYSPWTNHNK